MSHERGQRLRLNFVMKHWRTELFILASTELVFQSLGTTHVHYHRTEHDS